MTSLHSLLGLHTANLNTSRWDEGRFVSSCTGCGLAMIKLPGQNWQLHKAAD